MNIAPKHLIVAACLTALGLSASAQVPQPAIVAPGPAPAGAAPAPMMQGHPMMQDRMARLQQHRAQRQAALKKILQIAPAQENAWNTWIAARRPAVNQRPSRAEFAQLTTPQRIDRMRAMRSARMAEMDRRGEATKAFYAALTPAQQTAFDALTARRGAGGMGGRHGGWGHHR